MTVYNTRCLWWYFCSVIYHVQWSKVGKLTESAENPFECKIFTETSSSLRGDESEQDSNFFQIYILWEKDNEGLKAWRTEKKINKYVHSAIENEIMQIMALRVPREVAENIQDVDFYSIMCDEATDVKNVSELVVCLRWVDEEWEAHDEFIGLKNMPNTDADSIVRELDDIFYECTWN